MGVRSSGEAGGEAGATPRCRQQADGAPRHGAAPATSRAAAQPPWSAPAAPPPCTAPPDRRPRSRACPCRWPVRAVAGGFGGAGKGSRVKWPWRRSTPHGGGAQPSACKPGAAPTTAGTAQQAQCTRGGRGGRRGGRQAQQGRQARQAQRRPQQAQQAQQARRASRSTSSSSFMLRVWMRSTSRRPICGGRQGRQGPQVSGSRCSAGYVPRSKGTRHPRGCAAGPPRRARRCRSRGRSGQTGAARGRSSWGCGAAAARRGTGQPCARSGNSGSREAGTSSVQRAGSLQAGKPAGKPAACLLRRTGWWRP